MKINRKIIKIFLILMLWGLVWTIFLKIHFFNNTEWIQNTLVCDNYPTNRSNSNILLEYSYENTLKINGKNEFNYNIWCFPWLDAGSFEIIWKSIFARDKNYYYEYWNYGNWINQIIVIKNRLDFIDRESFQVYRQNNYGNLKQNYGIVSDNKSVYYYQKIPNRDTKFKKLNNIDTLTFEFLKNWNYDRSLSEIYFQDKNWLYYAHLFHDGIYYRKINAHTVIKSDINYYSPAILDTWKEIIREGKILDYVDYKTLIWIWSVQEYKKDQYHVYDKNFDIIPNLKPWLTIDLGYKNKYYISDGNYFYIIWERENQDTLWYDYENVIFVEKTTQLIKHYKTMKKFYDNWGY